MMHWNRGKVCRWVGWGWVLYSTKLVKLGYSTTIHNPTQPHTRTNMSHCGAALPSSSFALSLSMGRAAAPPNHGTSTPRHHTQAESHRACARCCWFACLEGQNERWEASKNRERGVCLGLRWPPFIYISNNQLADGVDVRGRVGEEARLGRNVWGGGLPVVWVVKLIDKKNRQMGGPLALDGGHLMWGHNN